MQCKNCQCELETLALSERFTWHYWCPQCGMVLKHFRTHISPYSDELSDWKEEWKEPKSVENTKKLVNALIKAQDRKSTLASRLNRMAREEADRVDWGEDERR